MKTDRELLELAAKAAGVSLVFWQGAPYLTRKNPRLYMSETVKWNPIEDDADALRLAAKLELSVYINARLVSVTHSMKSFFELEITEEDPADVLAATRRAIVRAAASIGEQQCHT